MKHSFRFKYILIVLNSKINSHSGNSNIFSLMNKLKILLEILFACPAIIIFRVLKIFSNNLLQQKNRLSLLRKAEKLPR